MIGNGDELVLNPARWLWFTLNPAGAQQARYDGQTVAADEQILGNLRQFGDAANFFVDEESGCILRQPALAIDDDSLCKAAGDDGA
jgi:hypothetical protein